MEKTPNLSVNLPDLMTIDLIMRIGYLLLMKQKMVSKKKQHRMDLFEQLDASARDIVAGRIRRVR